MKFTKNLLLGIVLLIGAITADGAILWVGDTPQCNQSNHYDTLNLALLQAAINGPEADEIRLTDSVSYMGEVNGNYVLNGWNGSDNGELTLAGGYANCDGSLSGRTIIGDNTATLFVINNASVVTLRNIELTLGQQRAIQITGDSVVFLENVDVSSNASGIEVSGGAYLELDDDSLIQFNGDLAVPSKGGGIHCFGSNSEVSFSGELRSNRAASGGQIYIETGCFVTLNDGSVLRNGSAFDSAGAIMVHNGGELLSNGAGQLVSITGHAAAYGGALYVWGTGRATLLNTFIANNSGFERGSGIYAINGGLSSNQVVMDRVATCPFIISCSEFQANVNYHSVVYVKNSMVQLNRTLFDSNDLIDGDVEPEGLVFVESDARARLSHVNMINNDANFLLINYGITEVAHLTAVRNSYVDSGGITQAAKAWGNFINGDLQIQNSLWQDTAGGDSYSTFDSIDGKCNLIDVVGDWPNGTYTVGGADFINPPGGDSRQVAGSDGVDMCAADTFAWNTDRDIEFQVSPVN